MTRPGVEKEWAKLGRARRIGKKLLVEGGDE